MQETPTKDTMINSIANAVMNEAGTSNKPFGPGKSSNPYLDKLFENMNLNEKEDSVLDLLLLCHCFFFFSSTINDQTIKLTFNDGIDDASGGLILFTSSRLLRFWSYFIMVPLVINVLPKLITSDESFDLITKLHALFGIIIVILIKLAILS